MFLNTKDINKLPKLLNDKSIDHIIIMDHKGELAKNQLIPDDYDVIRLNMQPKNNKLNMQPKNNKKGNKNK